jgi:uncharacterized delta-60 repeat protein
LWFQTPNEPRSVKKQIPISQLMRVVFASEVEGAALRFWNRSPVPQGLLKSPKPAPHKLLAVWPFVALILFSTLAHAGPGDLDFSFDPASGVNGTVRSLVAQADGRVIIGGEFSTVRGAARSGIARLNADGTVDRTFDPGLGVTSVRRPPPRVGTNYTTTSGVVYSIASQPDGRLLIGGDFFMVNGVNRNRIARLNADGSLDTSFDPGTGASNTVYSIALQADGKVLIGGSFTNVNGVSRNCIARLNADGSVDNSFDLGTLVGTPSTYISSIAVQADGKVLVAGYFTSINGTNRNSIARLNEDGSLDAQFDPGTGTGGDFLYGSIRSIALQLDARVLVVGAFTSINGTNRNRIARLNADGSLDTTFDPGTGAQYDGIIFNPSVTSVALQSDGKVLVAGQFTTINGTNRNGIARLNADGSLDNTFDPGAGANGDVSCVAVQTDGRVMLGGSFSAINGTNRNDLARLNADGSVDGTFDPETEAGELAPDVSSIALQTDGKVLLGLASFFVDSYPGADLVGIERLNADGRWDNTFTAHTGTNGYVYSIALQSDGKVVLGGSFSTVNGTNRNCIARLNADGSLDGTFDPGTGADNTVYSIAVQPDGKVLLGGHFSYVNGTTRIRIARLNADGGVDGSFSSGTGADDDVLSVVVQPDGKALVGGDFTSINGTNRHRIARLNPDGSVDSTFDPGSGPNSVVQAVAIQPDGKVLLGGGFTTIGTAGRRYIARLDPQGTLDNTFTPGPWASIGFFSSYVHSIALQSDGKVLVGGLFSVTNGTSGNNIARLNVDGSLDSTFGPCLVDGGNVGSDVFSVVVQPDGRLLIGGSIGRVNGVTRERVARLLGDAATLVFGPVRDGGDFVARFQGTPGFDYTIEHMENLSSANWQKLTNRSAPTTDTGFGIGVFELRDLILPLGQRFYRAVYPAY